MRTPLFAGIWILMLVAASVGLATAPALADDPVDREVRGRDGETFLAKEGMHNRVYLDGNGERVVRLTRDASGEVRAAVLIKGESTQASRFSKVDFDRFNNKVKELGAAQPDTMIVSRYNPREDSFEVFVPSAKVDATKEMAAKGSVGPDFSVGTYSYTSTSRNADSAPLADPGCHVGAKSTFLLVAVNE